MNDMRCLVRAKSIVECNKRIDVKKREGWKPIMEPKLDDSQISWGDVSYICVMEREDTPEQKEKNKNRRFNHGGNRLWH